MLAMLCIVVVFGIHSLADWTWYVPGDACIALLCAGVAGRARAARGRHDGGRAGHDLVRGGGRRVRGAGRLTRPARRRAPAIGAVAA